MAVEKATEAVLRDTRVGCMVMMRSPPEEVVGEDSENEDDGPGPP